MFSLGFGTGTFIWFFTALRLLYFFRSKLSDNFINWIYRFAGGTMLLFAAAVALHVAFGTDWHALL